MNLFKKIYVFIICVLICGCNSYEYKCDDPGSISSAKALFYGECSKLNGKVVKIEEVYDITTIKENKDEIFCKAKGKFSIRGDYDEPIGEMVGNLEYWMHGKSGSMGGRCKP